jgi:hypothetical protein
VAGVPDHHEVLGACLVDDGEQLDVLTGVAVVVTVTAAPARAPRPSRPDAG